MALLNTILSIIGSVQAITPDIVAPGKMWHVLILETFSFMADYGWRIVVFTVLLKLVLSPLDFYQRYKMNKNQKITERLKPTMEKIQKQYGNDKQVFSQKQMELNRREGYSYFSSCLPAIVTMVVFITLWLSMNTVAQYMTLKEYTSLYDEYNTAYSQAIEEKDEATAIQVGQDVVYQLYLYGITQDYLNGYTDSETGEYVQGLKERYGLSDAFTLEDKDKQQASFLWIKNIWAPDVPWGDRAILDWESFVSATGGAGKKYNNAEYTGLSDAEFNGAVNPDTYKKVMGKLLDNEDMSRTNGYLILPILVVLLSVGSQLLSSMQQKKAGQVNAKGGMATSMKVMTFIMPFMMAIFAIQYASIFTLYMVTNTATTLFFNFAFTGVIKLIDRRRATRHHGIKTGSTRSAAPGRYDGIIHYVKGANPNAGARETAVQVAGGGTADKKVKKKKSDQPVTVKKSGRPDPNELMNTDFSSDKKRR